ncbi:hypothetical protein FRC17_010747 [Serendipita sp. 399]|nr:hypothetical protein FRC17_010747 [Serendipita sp. 399]
MGNHVLGAQASVNYTSAITFLYAVDIAFRPIAILWLCHFRGRLIATGAMVRKDAFVSSTWKKIVDWCFVVVTFAVGIIYASLTTYVNNAILKGNVLTAAQRLNYVRILKVVHRVIVAVIVLFAINVIVSLIALKVAQKRAKILDKVATFLLLITLPFVIVDAAEALFAEIWISTQKNYDTTLFSLIMIIVEGASRLMIYVGIVATMKFVSAPPSAHQGDYTAVSTTGQPTPGDHEKAGSGWDARPPSLGQYQQPPHDYSYQPYQPYTPPPKQDYGYQPYAQPPPQDQIYQPYATPPPPQDHIYQPYAPPAGPPPGR